MRRWAWILLLAACEKDRPAESPEVRPDGVAPDLLMSRPKVSQAPETFERATVLLFGSGT